MMRRELFFPRNLAVTVFHIYSTVESSSSTRFVKVRFDNKAGTQVKVIPSKGQNKNEGYTVQPHMTLDLNFEEKGQQNDIPIEFKVDNPWSTGDKLLMNGQQGSVTVVPSPNKDDIKLVTITAACKYIGALTFSRCLWFYTRSDFGGPLILAEIFPINHSFFINGKTNLNREQPALAVH